MTKRIRRLVLIDTCDDCPHDYEIGEAPRCTNVPPADEYRELPASGRIPRWCPLPKEKP